MDDEAELVPVGAVSVPVRTELVWFQDGVLEVGIGT